ncbi:hypothetical protein [Delftia acidovorans]|uniref:hypothetical protein n=1 Tax=Delftia acidovorans TaxID=80866 RepID=UPI001142187C|nr:hypothetical protein [Delftia acidovorans]
MSFTLYFLVAVILLGGTGVWFELHAYLTYVPTPENPSVSAAALRTAVLTFFPALAGTSCMQLIWDTGEFRSLRAFATSVLVILGVAAAAVAPAHISATVALSIGCIASGIAFWMWWIANAEQTGLQDINTDAPMGKDPNTEPAGDLNGFTV